MDRAIIVRHRRPEPAVVPWGGAGKENRDLGPSLRADFIAHASMHPRVDIEPIVSEGRVGMPLELMVRVVDGLTQDELRRARSALALAENANKTAIAAALEGHVPTRSEPVAPWGPNLLQRRPPVDWLAESVKGRQLLHPSK